ncbi:MAG: MBL fold metallo-hydrolase [Candidatus Thermoplasmatota archaeon]
MNTIKFLGTAGARFVVTKQLRASGGLWLSVDGTNILIDPGPGCLVHCLTSKPKLNPMDLDGIVLSHRHLDHSNDMNIMIEAMTNGGYTKKGVVFVPSDAVDDDPVVFRCFRNQVQRFEILHEKGIYRVGTVTFETPVRHQHGVETYGFNFQTKKGILSLITDTAYFNDLETYYPGDILIVNVVLSESKKEIQHLSLADAERILTRNKPKLGILTHFGMSITRGKPWEIAETLSKKLNIPIIAARDGMELAIEKYLENDTF